MISAGIIQCEDIKWPRVHMLDQQQKIHLYHYYQYSNMKYLYYVLSFFFNEQSWIYLTNNIVKYYYCKTFQFKITNILFEYNLKCNLFLWRQSWTAFI